MNRILISAIVVASLLLISCGDDENDLPPIEERINNAINGLRQKLTAPSDGWRLEYQPTDESGVFLFLLEFKDNGDVRIRSDVADNDGEFEDHTITYRVDNALGLELIFETFGVFHYLFEQDGARFGAEFEFFFKGEEEGNLVFESKSDITSPTRIVLEPADANDDQFFSPEIAQNLSAFQEVITPRVFGAETPNQQLILHDQGISLFWQMDSQKRNILVEFAAFGTSADEVLTGGFFNVTHSTGYSLSDGKMILLEPVNFFLGRSITISEIAFSDFSMNGPRLCGSAADNTPLYEGTASGLGDVTMHGSLLTTRGIDYTPSVYSVNVDFLFDNEGNSLAEEDGIITQKFPEASGFVIFYGVELINPDIPIYSLGIILEDGSLYLREYEPTNTMINLIEINLKDDFYFSDGEPPGAADDLREITDQIFEGGELYAFEFPITGITVFKLFNPCNQNEIFLVR